MHIIRNKYFAAILSSPHTPLTTISKDLTIIHTIKEPTTLFKVEVIEALTRRRTSINNGKHSHGQSKQDPIPRWGLHSPY